MKEARQTMKDIIIKEAPQNSNYRMYHTKHRLMFRNECFYSECSHKTIDETNISLPIKTIFQKAEQLIGVEDVWVEKYEFRLTKGKNFSWEEIEPQFHRLLVTYLPPVNNYNNYNN